MQSSEITLKRTSSILSQKFFRYLLPSLLTMAALSLSEFADSMLVSNLIGANAMSIIQLGLLGKVEKNSKTNKELFSIIKGKKANDFEDKIKNLKIINIDTEHDNFMKGYALYKIALNMEMTISNLPK